jgi:hypothetical protein
LKTLISVIATCGGVEMLLTAWGSMPVMPRTPPKYRRPFGIATAEPDRKPPDRPSAVVKALTRAFSGSMRDSPAVVLTQMRPSLSALMAKILA